jgi:predicted N-acetyltransferase YhbS
MVRIIEERPGDIRAREALLDASFGPERRFKTVERLRRGRLPADGLALVATDRGRLVGTVRLWEVEAGAAGPALLLGPIAVDAARRSRGIGAALMRRAIAEAAARGHRAVLLVGDAPYYARFGFNADLTRELALPGPVDADRFLALELVPDALRNAIGPVVATGRSAAAPLAA